MRIISGIEYHLTTLIDELKDKIIKCYEVTFYDDNTGEFICIYYDCEKSNIIAEFRYYSEEVCPNDFRYNYLVNFLVKSCAVEVLTFQGEPQDDAEFENIVISGVEYIRTFNAYGSFYLLKNDIRKVYCTSWESIIEKDKKGLANCKMKSST